MPTPEPGVERTVRVLKHRLDPRAEAAASGAVEAGHVYTVEDDAAPVQPLETQDELGQRALAAAGLSHEGVGLSGVQRQVHAIHGLQHAPAAHREVATHVLQR